MVRKAYKRFAQRQCKMDGDLDYSIDEQHVEKDI